MRVCFVASEVAPFAKTGGLADVSGALPKYLQLNGCDLRVFMPFYDVIDRSKWEFRVVDFLQGISIRIGERTHIVNVYTTKLPGSEVDVYFIDAPALYNRGSIYTDADDEYLRFLLLSQAALQCCQYMGWAPDIVHCNDWQTALIPLLLRTVFHWDALFRSTRTVLTIHNIAYQGVFSSKVLREVGLEAYQHLFYQEDLVSGVVSYMKAGILYADILTTVSRTYAHEIQTAEYGSGLEVMLRRRATALVGIVNGVDLTEWSPELDQLIPYNFSSDDLSGKERNKESLIHRVELPFHPAVPVLGVVSRLTAQKGFELFEGILEPMLQNYDMQLVVLGSGEAKYERYFFDLERRFPHKVCFYRGFQNELAHLIEAGADIFVMPSKFEPCGLNQIYSLRYGTIPIVRRTGGLADTVVNFNPITGEGTGFVFEHFNSQGLAWGIESAVKTWYLDRPSWRRLMANAMAEDFSWERQVQEYLSVYRRLVPEGLIA